MLLKGNYMTDATCVTLPKLNFFERLVLYWETRDLGKRNEDLITLISVAIFFDRTVYPEELDMAERILERYIKSSGKRETVMERIKMRLQEYIDDYLKFLMDRERAFDILTDNIQLYSAMRDIFEADGKLSEIEKEAEEVIRKEYDKHWQRNESRELMKMEPRWK